MDCILPGWAGTLACSSQRPLLDCLSFCMESLLWITAKSGMGSSGTCVSLYVKAYVGVCAIVCVCVVGDGVFIIYLACASLVFSPNFLFNLSWRMVQIAEFL